MNGLRFQEGEQAIFACPRSFEAQEEIGNLCTVALVGPWAAGQTVQLPDGQRGYLDSAADYLIDCGDSWRYVRDWQLRKLNPPAEPASITRDSEVTA